MTHAPNSPPSTDSPSLPGHGALLGLDYGTKRLGIAVCNADQTIAVPVETWMVRSPEQNLRHLRELIEDYRAVGIVLGLPVRLSGAEGDQAGVVRQFGNWLADQTRLPVAYWDERYSSMEAEVLLWTQGISPTKSKERLDRLAAQIILQAFLDAPDRTSPPAPKV
ncbi:MAG: Holliday junction resolvase RuvX [Planctomycetes bacterium]|nr:Holliday junction resolvase RuvX [Planctomycetota bacterium]